MNPILLFTLLCPDTAYFREPFPVHIVQNEPAPPGYHMPDAWEVRAPLAGILDGQRFSSVPDSVIVLIPGPATYLEAGVRASFSIGTFDSKLGEVKALPGAWCMTVMKARPATMIKPRMVRPGVMYRQGFRLDGRYVK